MGQNKKRRLKLLKRKLVRPKKIQKRVSLMKKIEQYEISDGKIVRKRQFCPKEECGPGVFLAVHKDRVSCGKCGYTKFND